MAEMHGIFVLELNPTAEQNVEEEGEYRNIRSLLQSPRIIWEIWSGSCRP